MRYRALETMRQYGRDRLDDTGDPEVWRRRHAEHYAAFAERAGAEMLGIDELAWRPRVVTELDNLRAAVAWALDAEDRTDRELGVRIIVGLSNEANSGAAFEVAAWAERALPFVDEMTSAERAGVLNAAAWSALLAGDLDGARTRAYAALRERVPGFCSTTAYVQLAYIASIEDDYDRAMEILDEARSDVDAHPDAPHAAMSKATVLDRHPGVPGDGRRRARNDPRGRR